MWLMLFPASHTLTVTASDGTNSDTATVTVTVNDINDIIPSCTTPLYYEVNEDVTVGTMVVNGNDFACTDGDTSAGNQLIHYSMTAGDFIVADQLTGGNNQHFFLIVYKIGLYIDYLNNVMSWK